MSSLPLSLDGLGVLASSLCLVHCLCLPLLAFALPGLVATLGGEVVHRVLLAFVLPLALIALPLGYRRHRVRGPLVLGGLAVLLLVLVVGLEESLPHEMGEPLSWLANGALIVAHLWNRRASAGGACGSC